MSYLQSVGSKWVKPASAITVPKKNKYITKRVSCIHDCGRKTTVFVKKGERGIYVCHNCKDLLSSSDEEFSDMSYDDMSD